MALTYGQQPFRTSVGARFMMVVPTTLDSSYPAGGYTVDRTMQGMFPANAIDAVWSAGMNQAAAQACVFVQYNTTTNALQCYYATGRPPGIPLTEASYNELGSLVEVAPGTNLSNYTYQLVVIGR